MTLDDLANLPTVGEVHFGIPSRFEGQEFLRISTDNARLAFVTSRRGEIRTSYQVSPAAEPEIKEGTVTNDFQFRDSERILAHVFGMIKYRSREKLAFARDKVPGGQDETNPIVETWYRDDILDYEQLSPVPQMLAR